MCALNICIRRDRGSMIIEALVALLLISVIQMAFVAAFRESVRNWIHSRRTTHSETFRTAAAATIAQRLTGCPGWCEVELTLPLTPPAIYPPSSPEAKALCRRLRDGRYAYFACTLPSSIRSQQELLTVWK